MGGVLKMPMQLYVKTGVGQILSNGHSPANLANLSTRQNGLFWKSFRLARLEFAKNVTLLGTRQTRIRQNMANLVSLANLWRIR
jgi:hypothetical protein